MEDGMMFPVPQDVREMAGHMVAIVASALISLGVFFKGEIPEGLEDIDIPADAYDAMLILRDVVGVAHQIGPVIANMAIFDGSMPEDVRADFFPGEYVVDVVDDDLSYGYRLA